ncbi:restriction endonuclease subunit S [Halomonas cerina]|uniref:Type I restriction enzyme S subunit n=1 Tax=Halomonas cerina TaxID=447424 RepID=A0A839V410_9GAMM|nr:restriction endonuclease subunit S [Halomonas cerina]MBB3190433.1 type I restriction enzyme S subunit [Halomonas cerina]
MSARELITEHLDLWTGAVTHKSSAGRGRNGKIELTGIKKLRELILELAVRGKLVEQDPNDEPASVLLERIAEEKARLVKEGQIKRPKGVPEIEKGEEKFPLPKSWEWARFGTITFNRDSERIPLSVSERSRRQGEYVYYGASGVIDNIDDFLFDKPLLLIGEDGANLINRSTPISFIARGKYWVNNHAHVIDGVSEGFLGYLSLYINSISLEPYITGTAQPKMNQAKMNTIPVGLPPIQEQQRILEKVDELMALCDRLEQQVGDQLEAHEVLVDTLLDALTRSADAAEVAENWARISEHFDTLFTTEASIDKLKQTILQLAVMGRLVPQDPDDGPAESLLTRLASERQIWLDSHKDENPECATMLRKLKKLRTPKPPFDLPRGWAAAHLIQLSKILVDCHNKTAPYVDEGIPIIRTSNIRERSFRFDDLKYVSEETYQYWSRRCPPEPKDIIFTREAPMGEAAIIPEGAKWCLGQRTMLIRPMLEHINEEYLLLALTEPHLLERASEKAIGSTVKHLRVGDVERLAIPVPPLVEQNRIVDKVDELMALCDQLKARLGEVGETRTQLAEAVVEQAVS